MQWSWPPVRDLTALLGSGLIARWMASIETKVAYYDRSMDPIFPEFRGPNLYVFWHEYILNPLALRGHNRLAMLISRHQKTDLLERIAGHMGFECVRGSSSRGGAGALRELIKLSKTKNLTMTPDGPRGPRRVMSQGPIYMAAKLGMPLVLIGYGYDRPWRVGSWDRFAIPRPGSRGRCIMSPPIMLPSDLDRDGLEHYRLRMQTMLNRLCDEAEAWAISGRPKLGEMPMLREPRRFPMPWETADTESPATDENGIVPPPHLAIGTHAALDELGLHEAG